MALEDTNVHTTELQPRCEYVTPLFSERECRMTGEVRSHGSLLCVSHAELLRLEEREGTMLGRVFEMDKWLDNPDNRADELRWRRVLHQRDEAVEHLSYTRILVDAHKELDP